MPRGIVCSPPPRYRLSVSTCAAKVRASLLKAPTALSCCGILITGRFFAREENRNRATDRRLIFFARKKFFPKAGVMRFYPPEIRAWINRHGGLMPQLMTMRGRELAALYPPCP